MIKQFEKLTDEERERLYNAPVLVSVLASCSFNNVNKARKAEAIKLAHLKTFTAAPVLLPYYAEVEKKFEERFEAEIEKYYPFDAAKQKALKKEMDSVNTIIKKLDPDYAQILYKSFERYSRHVKRAAHSIFTDFIFPVPIHGLTD